METAYWGTEMFTELDAEWSPSSSVSQISDQENHRPQQQQQQQQKQQQQQQQQQQQSVEYSGTDDNQNIMDISGALSHAYGIFCDLEQGEGHEPGSSESDRSSSGAESAAKCRPGSAASGTAKKARNPIKRLHQRNAANMRERRRMKTINDAFEGLRQRIPLATGERKLSKVDTLRLAIRYIQHLSEMVDTCDSVGPAGRGQHEQAKVVIRYPVNAGYSGYCDDPYGADQYQLYGHSLSWQQHSQVGMAVDNKLSAKLWTPHVATQQDLDEMRSYVS